MKIAFIGFGEAARAFCASLSAQEPGLRFSAYDILLDGQGLDGPCGKAMREHGVEIAGSAGDALRQADWIFSAVTADQSLAAVRSVAPSVSAGQILFDINSVSPGRKRDSAALLAGSGALYLDMAVMAPVHPRGHRTPVLIAGAAAEPVTSRLALLGFDFGIAGAEAGAATAVKMVRSLFVKGLEAITVETLLAASASGCLDHIVRSLDASYPELKIESLARYQFERTLTHGRRRAAEMRESAETLDQLGLCGPLAAGIADVQERMGAAKRDDRGQDDLAALVAEVLAARRS